MMENVKRYWRKKCVCEIGILFENTQELKASSSEKRGAQHLLGIVVCAPSFWHRQVFFRWFFYSIKGARSFPVFWQEINKKNSKESLHLISHKNS
jgi:hypothetical protein